MTFELDDEQLCLVEGCVAMAVNGTRQCAVHATSTWQQTQQHRAQRRSRRKTRSPVTDNGWRDQPLPFSPVSDER